MGPKSVVLAIIVILVLALAFIAITYKPLNNYIDGILGIHNTIYITGVSFEINGATNESCFGNVVQPLPGFYAQKGGEFSYTVNLTDACTGPRNITNVNVLNSGFSIKSVSPRLPYEVFGGNRVQLGMEISHPSGFSAGVLTLQLNVT
ncbi:MAG: hypothetical protein ABSE71_04620 [Candidatus Micrarchaeaceae archaeon]|jgi:hypothetical protein|nr:hypothetical protein [Candidatus Micrarchaeota archaeon]HII09678.1 hypothetical protein [Candidatus Micrarchaeota archaeon]